MTRLFAYTWRSLVATSYRCSGSIFRSYTNTGDSLSILFHNYKQWLTYFDDVYDPNNGFNIIKTMNLQMFDIIYYEATEI